MKITKLEKVKFTIKTKKKLIAGHGSISGITIMLIKVFTDEEITGVGEGIANPVTEAAFNQYIEPYVIGKDVHDIELMLNDLVSHKNGGLDNAQIIYRAFCPLEYALWDIMGQAAKQPICKLIGGPVRREINFVAEIYYSPGADVKDYVKNAVAFVKEKGFKMLKLKGGFSAEMDVAVVKEVRKAVGDRVGIILDPNGAWSLATALRIIDKIAKYDIMWVENPLPFFDLEGTARLRKILNSNVPIALCEGTNRIGGIWEIIDIVRRGAADVISIDTRRNGGIYMAKKAAAIAEAAGIPVTVHSGSGTGLHIAYFLHLLSTIPNLYFGGTADSLLPYYEDDVITKPWDFTNGCLPVPLQPGVGVKLDERKIKKYADQFKKEGYRTKYEWVSELPQFTPSPRY